MDQAPDAGERSAAPNPEPAAGPIPVITAADGARMQERPKRPKPPGRPPSASPAAAAAAGGELKSTKPKPPPPTTTVTGLVLPDGGPQTAAVRAATRAIRTVRGKRPTAAAGQPKAHPKAAVSAKPGSIKPGTKPGPQGAGGRSDKHGTGSRPDRSSAAARRMLRRLVQGEAPPTQAMSLVERLAGSPYANPVRFAGTDASARKTLDFALSLAETMFRFGAGALEVETAMIAVTTAFDLDTIEVDITNQSVLLNYSPKDQTPITVMRVVRSWTNNYAGLALVHQLVTDIADGGVSRAEAANRLEEINQRPKPFPRWAVTVSTGVFAAAIVAFIGGGPLASLLGFASTILVSLLQRLFGRLRIPDFFTTAASGFVVTALAMAIWALGEAGTLNLQIAPGLVVAGGILLLLPTGRLVSAVQDAINGFPVTASGRFLSAFLTFGAIVAGIAVALVFGAQLGIPALDVTSVSGSQYGFVTTLVLLAVALGTISITEQTPMRMILPTVAVGLVGYLAMLLSELAGMGPRLTPAIAAVIIGVLARVVALRLGAPQLIVAVPAILFLFPGLSIFRSMYGLTIGIEDISGGVVGLFNALTVILAIAGGVVLGDNLARPLTRSITGVERRNRRR